MRCAVLIRCFLFGKYALRSPTVLLHVSRLFHFRLLNSNWFVYHGHFFFSSSLSQSPCVFLARLIRYFDAIKFRFLWPSLSIYFSFFFLLSYTFLFWHIKQVAMNPFHNGEQLETRTKLSIIWNSCNLEAIFRVTVDFDFIWVSNAFFSIFQYFIVIFHLFPLGFYAFLLNFNAKVATIFLSIQHRSICNK